MTKKNSDEDSRRSVQQDWSWRSRKWSSDSNIFSVMPDILSLINEALQTTMMDDRSPRNAKVDSGKDTESPSTEDRGNCSLSCFVFTPDRDAGVIIIIIIIIIIISIIVLEDS